MEVANVARMKYRAGCISREEAKEQIAPYIEYVNNKSKEIAKKYNKKTKLMNFTSYIR